VGSGSGSVSGRFDRPNRSVERFNASLVRFDERRRLLRAHVHDGEAAFVHEAPRRRLPEGEIER